MADIRKNNEIDWALSLRTNATSIRQNDVAANWYQGVRRMWQIFARIMKLTRHQVFGRMQHLFERMMQLQNLKLISHLLLTMHLSPHYYPFQRLYYRFIFIVSQALILLIIQPCGKIILHGTNQSYLFFNYSFFLSFEIYLPLQ